MKNELIGDVVRYAERIRMDLHQHPEAAFQETFTTNLIRACVEENAALAAQAGAKLSLIPLEMDTGAAVLLDARKENTIALRGDIDAVSTEKGFLHLCGHDYHTASLLGAMRYLCMDAAEIPFNLLFIFQPAEESTDGAAAMIEHGLLERLPQKPIRLFGIHNRPELPVGKVAVHRGALMAEKSNFRITFTGKAGHGGSPHHCIDPITAAAQFILAMQTVVSKNVDPMESAVCGVFSVHSGTEVNNPPDAAVLTGTIRALSHEAFLRMTDRVECIARSSAACFECGSELEWIPLVPLLYNGDAMYETAKAAAAAVVGESGVVETEPTLASDDFAVFGQHIPSFYYWVGSGTDTGESRPWHDPGFCVAPGYLNIAIPLLIQSAVAK